MDAKQELNARLNTLAALQTKLQTMAVTDEERDILESLLANEQERETCAWRRERAEQAIDLLFPSWRGGRIEQPKHPLWHEKSWWWNGASIESLHECMDGDLEVTLSSYVGCGETDTIDGFILKNEWLEADDMPAVIHAFMKGEAARKEAKKAAQEMARAQADVVAAQKRLATLQAGA
ncbi:hypothetical protein WL29_20590 [Burkholderia ubonensis]|uniref:Uncharacterized protein n=1 Tax=Burkholderia ubonensis TaxID=101571 RepID=A0A106QC56_9BURK|nr:hypothetical protein [Burkholderia ubonensis]KWA83765.1 hypothetical protein WL29_20590 [Burkholderia ubonensis]